MSKSTVDGFWPTGVGSTVGFRVGLAVGEAVASVLALIFLCAMLDMASQVGSITSKLNTQIAAGGIRHVDSSAVSSPVGWDTCSSGRKIFGEATESRCSPEAQAEDSFGIILGSVGGIFVLGVILFLLKRKELSAKNQLENKLARPVPIPWKMRRELSRKGAETALLPPISTQCVRPGSKLRPILKLRTKLWLKKCCLRKISERLVFASGPLN